MQVNFYCIEIAKLSFPSSRLSDSNKKTKKFLKIFFFRVKFGSSFKRIHEIFMI